ncbi:sulfotransferase 2A1-like [Castor canadensis]|uniref:Sulfotransferase 2A1-like n=1 Tax=Castor canadensis TaxID=51338 RepID=A0AC58L9X1_CASCN
MFDDYLWFEGVPLPSLGFKPEIIRELRDNFVVKDEDIVTLSYPKSGTNWLVEILCLIHTKGDPKWIQSMPIWDRAPWLEAENGFMSLQGMEGPRLITSHLPFQLFPRSFSSSKAKVIYIIRNPRDVSVSGYFFWEKMNICKIAKSWDEYFEWFIQGNVPYGSWFEHIHGWMSMRERKNFLVLSYEELKKDTRGTIEKICKFLRKKLEPEELDLVLKYSSFDAMKENKMSNFSLFLRNDSTILLRKGVTGDWKNHFSEAQVEAFNKTFREKMAGFPPGLFPWE